MSFSPWQRRLSLGSLIVILPSLPSLYFLLHPAVCVPFPMFESCMCFGVTVCACMHDSKSNAEIFYSKKAFCWPSIFLSESGEDRERTWLEGRKQGRRNKGRKSERQRRGGVMESDNRNCWITSCFLGLGCFQAILLAPVSSQWCTSPSSVRCWLGSKLLPSPGISPSLTSQSF